MKKRKTYEISVIDRTYSKTISDETKFYTSDTSLEIVFKLKETEYNFDSAEIVFLNENDKSLITRRAVKSDEGFVYEFEKEIIAHYGEWKAQLMLIENGEAHVSSPIKFRIENDLYTTKPQVLSDVVSWVNLKLYAEKLVGEFKQAVDAAIAKNVEIENTFKTNEQSRQTRFETAESERNQTFNTNEETRQANEDARIEAEKQREGTVKNIETRQNSVENQFISVQEELTEKDVISAPEIIAARKGEANLKTRLDKEYQEVSTQLAQTKKRFLKPQYIEFFGSFNRFGLGVPTGIRNYAGGNYVLTVSGNAGDSFVTVESGNIADAGTTVRWACVIENNDGLFEVNQVTGTDGVSKINLLEPLENSVTSKRLGNLHDSSNGQHYTELGYFSFTQHMYNMHPRHAERNSFIAQFKPTDETSSWKIESPYALHNRTVNMTFNNYFRNIGKNFLSVSVRNNLSDYVEWEQSLSEEKGYLESYIGVSEGTATVSFFKDGALSETVTIGPEVERVVFEYDGVSVGKIKIVGNGPYNATGSRQAIHIGLTTWWINEKFQDKQLIDQDDKVVFMGDSWGEYHNKATTRELERLMIADGGTPTILNYSKGGHTSTYARVWFDEYVIKNKPHKVIIEYFTNDFNSIGKNTDYVFINPNGQEQDMKINSLDEYVDNINYMVERAIENGIQPIVIMPASTNSELQTQKFADYAVQLWLGKSTMNKNPSFDSISSENVTTSKIESTVGISATSGSLPLVSKQVSSSVRKGVVSDTDTGAKITNGDIHGFYNNGERVAGVRHNGVLQVPYLKLGENDSGSAANEDNRGNLLLFNGVSSNYEDELRIVIKRSDGTYVTKKIQLID